jgi:hypothetical protein
MMQAMQESLNVESKMPYFVGIRKFEDRLNKSIQKYDFG